MKKVKYIIFLVFIFFVFYEVKAATCSNDEIKRLQEVANNVEIKTNYEIKVYEKEYEEDDDTDLDFVDAYAIYKINIVNSNSELLYYYKTSKIENKELVDINNLANMTFTEDDKLTFYIYSNTLSTCPLKLLKTINVELPVYNRYYYQNKEKCNLYPDFKYCKEFMKVNSNDYEKIDNLFDEYINENTSQNKESKSIDDYKIYFIIGGCVFLSIIVWLGIKNHKKNSI